MGIAINLRDFANQPEEMVLRWRGFRFAATVTDDYGQSTKTDTFALLLTWQGLILHRRYNDVKYSIDELVPSNADMTVAYNDDVLAVPTNWATENIMEHVDCPIENDRAKRLIHVWQNKLNNLLVAMTEGQEISATAEVVAELMEDPGIMELRDRVLEKKISIDDAEKEFAVYLMTAPSLDFNTFALLARTGGVSINQAYQTAIIRGATFDLGNQIFPNPVKVPYGHGITKVSDVLGERNAAGKALTNNGKALKDSEWFHRKTHLLAAVLHNIGYVEDCGTSVGMTIRLINQEQINSLRGKFEILEDGTSRALNNKTLKPLKAGDVIKLRSPAFCRSHDAGMPCGVCYGKMKASIPYNTIMMQPANPGMYSATAMCNPLGQKMLSTKHFIRNATSKKFEPATRDKDIIFSNGDEIFLREELCAAGSELVLRSSIVKDLSDLKSLDVLDDVGLDKLPYFSEVTFRYQVEDIMMGGSTTQQHSAVTSVSSRNARFSLDFLKFVLEKGWNVVDKRFISIDLSDWNSLAPMFSLPYTREDLDMHRARVENFMTFNKRNTAWRNQVVNGKIFGEVLSEFWQLVNQEIKGLNIVHLETLLYACLARDPANGNYSLANGNGDKYFTSFVSCIENRGAGALMLYEKQQNVLSNPRTFTITDRQGSVLESFWSQAAD